MSPATSTREARRGNGLMLDHERRSAAFGRSLCAEAVVDFRRLADEASKIAAPMERLLDERDAYFRRLPDLHTILFAFVCVTLAACGGVAVPLIWQEHALRFFYLQLPLTIYAFAAAAALVAIVRHYRK